MVSAFVLGVSRRRGACRAVALGADGYGPPTFHFGAAAFAFTVFRRRLVERLCWGFRAWGWPAEP